MVKLVLVLNSLEFFLNIFLVLHVNDCVFFNLNKFQIFGNSEKFFSPFYYSHVGCL